MKPGPKPKNTIRYHSRPRRRMTVEYSAFIDAKSRCSRKPGEPDYEDYAGRGIEFLFKSFEQFLKGKTQMMNQTEEEMNFIQKLFVGIYVFVAVLGTITLWELAKVVVSHVHIFWK